MLAQNSENNHSSIEHLLTNDKNQVAIDSRFNQFDQRYKTINLSQIDSEKDK